uniref:Uncharacterized protein n=1 Tax=Anguilla anguilla TaxID=7936 RepID=A0A0E9W0Q9_ANGAN
MNLAFDSNVGKSALTWIRVYLMKPLFNTMRFTMLSKQIQSANILFQQ